MYILSFKIPFWRHEVIALCVQQWLTNVVSGFCTILAQIVSIPHEERTIWEMISVFDCCINVGGKIALRCTIAKKNLTASEPWNGKHEPTAQVILRSGQRRIRSIAFWWKQIVYKSGLSHGNYKLDLFRKRLVETDMRTDAIENVDLRQGL